MRASQLCVIASALCLMGATAQAEVIFDSTVLTPWGVPNGDLNADDIVAQSFFVGPSASLQLNQVSLILGSTGSGVTGAGVLVFVAPDNGFDAPNTGASTLLGTILDVDVTSGYHEYSLTAGVNLIAGSTYWIVLSDSAAGDSGITWAIGDFGAGPSTGTAGSYVYQDTDPPTTWQVGPDNGDTLPYVMQMRIETPEPISLALFGTGLLGLGLASRWRSKKTA